MEKVSRHYIAKIQTEMNAAIKAGRPQSFFNNFNLNFEHYRMRAEQGKIMDTVHSEFWTQHQNFSELFMSQTPRQFFEAIDTVVKELKLEAIVKALLDNPDQKQAFLANVAPKIFIKLLEGGYHAEELVI